jgi:hypothetical protein
MTKWLLIAMVFCACNSAKVIFHQSTSKQNSLTIRNVNYAHCGCAHIYAEKINDGRREFLIGYTNQGTTKSIYRYDSSGISGTVILKGVATDDYTIPLDSTDKIIFQKIDSFVQKAPSAPAYRLNRPIVKGYVTS